MPVGPILSAVDSIARTVTYKGLTGRPYVFDTNIPSALHVAHGTTLQYEGETEVESSSPTGPENNGPITSGSNLFTVVGVSAATAAPCDLWIHEHGAPAATLVKSISTAEELFSKYRTVEYPPHSTPFVGPLGISYHFQTSQQQLLATFGVSQDEKYFLKALNVNVRIVGELMGVLWVAREDSPSVAEPLPNCVNEDTLHGLYGLCEAIATSNNGSRSSFGSPPSSSQLISTPRRATHTPRRAGAGALSVDTKTGIATCSGPMGVKLRCDITAEALKTFGVIHNQKMVSRTGLDAGKFCRVIGVAGGALHVLYDGDSRVTCVRSCDGAERLKEHFAVGDDSAGSVNAPNSRSAAAPATATSTPVRATSGKPAIPSIATSKVAPANNTLTSPASPRLGNKIKLFWTTFGRLEFDTSDFGCSEFGFHHGQVVRGGKGTAKGKMYTVVGARLGNLWVLEEGKYRATALIHCTDKAQLTEMYKLTPTGALKDLRPYYNAHDEPPATPMHTPRFRLSQSPQRERTNESFGASAAEMASMPPLSPRGGSAAPFNKAPSVELSPLSVGPSVSQSQRQLYGSGLVSSTGPTSATGAASALPTLNFGNVTRDNAPLPSAVVEHQYIQQRQSASHAMDASAASANATSYSASSIALAQPSAREYLKAWALLKMGQRTVITDGGNLSASFHTYYMHDTVKRIGEAFARLPRARQVWADESRSPAFYQASTAELLRFLSERPSVSAY